MGNTIRFNLAIVFTPSYQDMEPWAAIKARIDATAPDIEARIVLRNAPRRENLEWIPTRPCLSFSPFSLHDFPSRHGARLCGGAIPKRVEIERLQAGGISVPGTAAFTVDADIVGFSDYVIVKPDRGGYLGQNIRLAEKASLRQRFDELTYRGLRDMLVQQFVDGELDEGRPVEYRVYCVLGRVFSAMRRKWKAPRPPLALLARDPNAVVATSVEGVAGPWELCGDTEVIGFASKIPPIFPELPCLGLDILRERETGRLYALEVDSIGTDIKLIPSSEATPAERAPFYSQFGGLDAIADSLAEATRRLAA